MSAYKTAFIRLGETEYKRLREAEEELRLYHLKKSSKKSNIEQNQSIYENMVGITRQNDQNFQKMVVDLESEIQRIENETSAWVEAQAIQMHADFESDRNQFQNRAKDQLNHLMAQTNQQIQHKEIAMQEYWLAQEEKINSIENRWQAYEELALDWIQKDQNILDFICHTYAINSLEANQLENQRQYLNQVIEQYNMGVFDIAASAGFQIFINLSNIRFQLEINRSNQAFSYHNMLIKTDALLESIQDSNSVHAMDNEGNELSEMIDVNYWIDGRYRDYTDEAFGLIQEIKSNPAMDISEIIQYEARNR